MSRKNFMIIGLACLLGLGGCSSQAENAMSKEEDSSQTVMSKEQLQKAPDFELTGVDGKTYRLSDLKGKKVYLKFWASWCSICLSSLEDTEQLAVAAKDKDYVVLSLVSPGHNREKSEMDFKEWYQGLETKTLPVLLDPSGKVLQDYHVRAYPSAAFIDSKGHLAQFHTGYMAKEEIEKTLEALD